MADISIGNNHLAYLTRMQNLLEWLQGEQIRLAIEHQAVMRHGAQLQGELIAFLQQSYGIDAQHTSWTLATERGVIITPDEPQPEPAEESPAAHANGAKPVRAKPAASASE